MIYYSAPSYQYPKMVNLFKLLLTSAAIISVISLLKQNYSIHSEIQSLSYSDLILTLSCQEYLPTKWADDLRIWQHQLQLVSQPLTLWINHHQIETQSHVG